MSLVVVIENVDGTLVAFGPFRGEGKAQGFATENEEPGFTTCHVLTMQSPDD